MKRFAKYVAALIVFGAAAAGAWAQSAIPATAGTYLGITGSAGQGDTDQFMVAFFEVPDTVSSPIYFAVQSPGMEDTDALNTNRVNGDSRWDLAAQPSYSYHLVGGTGTVSNVSARDRTFANATAAQTGGELLATITSTTDFPDDAAGWYTFPAVYPSQGEHIGNKYYFKVIAEAPSGSTAKNGFRLNVGYNALSGTGSPTEVTGARAFAYTWTVQLISGLSYDLYPFIHDTAANYLMAMNHDMDGTGTLTLTDPLAGAGNADVSANNADSDRALSNTTVAGKTGSTWHLAIGSGTPSMSDGVNMTEFWFENTVANNAFSAVTDEYLKTYSQSYTPAAADHVAISLQDGAAKADGTDTETVTLQLVDSSGDPVSYVRPIYVKADRTTAVISPNVTVTPALAYTEAVTTNADGMATFTISDTVAETVTITVETNGASGDSADDSALVTPASNGSAQIVFATNPAPKLSSASNTSFTENNVKTLPTIRVSANGGTLVTAANDIRIRIPSTLTAHFNDALTTPTLNLTGTGVVAATVAYTDGSSTDTILTIDVTTDFGSTDTLDISGLALTAANSDGTGYLELSYNGGSTWTVIDDKAITILDVNQTYTWIGTTTAWDLDTNWTPTGVPDTNTENALVPYMASGIYPTISSPVTINNLTVAASATVTAGTNLTIAGAISASGTISGTLAIPSTLSGTYTTGGGSLSFTSAVTLSGDTTINTGSGSVSFSGAGTANGAYALYINSDSTVTFSTAIGGGTPLTRIQVGGAGSAVVNAGASFSAAGNTIQYDVPVTFNADTTLTETVGSIIFNDTVTLAAAVDLTLTAPEIDFNGGAGSVTGTPTSTITINSDGADPISLAAAANTTNNLLELTSSDIAAIAAGFQSITVATTGGISWDGAATLNSPTTLADNFTLSSGTMTLAAALGISGTTTISGGTLTDSANTITTTGSSVALGGTLTLSGSWVFGASADLTSNGQALNTVSVVNGFTLTLQDTAAFAGSVAGLGTLNANSQDLSVGGNWTISAFTEALSTVTFNGTGAQSVTGDSAFAAVVIDKTAGSVSFGPALTATGLSTGLGKAFGVSFNATAGAQASTIGGTTTLDCTGAVSFGDDAGDSVQFTGGIAATAASGVTLIGSLLTDGGAVDFTNQTITLASTATIDTEQGNNGAAGAITLTGSTVNSNGVFSLTLDASTTGAFAGGNVALGIVADGTNDTVNLTVDTTGGGSNGTFTAASLVYLAGTLSLDIGSGNSADVSVAGTDIAALSVTSANNVTVSEASGFYIAGAAVSGNLTITSTGSLTDSATVSVVDLSVTVGSGQSISLDTTTNTFSGTLAFAASAGNIADLSIYDTTAVTLPAPLTISGTLTVTSGDTIGQGAGALTGATLIAKTLNDSGAAITLDNAGNDFDTVSILSRDALDTAPDTGAVAYVDTDGFALGAAGVKTASTVALSAGGNVTQGGDIEATTLTLTSTAAGGFTLANAANAVTTLAAGGALLGSLSFSDADGYSAGAISTASVAGGAVTLGAAAGTVTLTGNITTDGGAVTVSQAARIADSTTIAVETTNGGATPAGALIDFTSTLNAIMAGTAGSLSADSGTSNAQFGAIGGTTPLGGLTVNGGAVTLAGAKTNAATGNQTFTGASIATSGAHTGNALSVTVKNDTAQSIIFTDATNDFAAITLRNFMADGTTPWGTSPAIQYVDANGFDIAGIVAASTQTATLTSGGAVTDSGAASVGTLEVVSVGGATLNFGHTVSYFGASNTGSGNVVFVNTASPLYLGTGSYSVTTVAGGAITIDNTGAVVVNNANVDTTSGTVTIDTRGAGTITRVGAGSIIGDTINLQTGAGSTGAIGASGTPVQTIGSAGGTGLALGNATDKIAGVYLSHSGAGALTVSSLNLAASASNPPLWIEAAASYALTLPFLNIDTGSGVIHLTSGTNFLTNGDLASTASIGLSALNGTLNIGHTLTGGTVTIISTGTTTLGANITTAGGNIDFSGAAGGIIVAGSSTLDSGNGDPAAAGAITFGTVPTSANAGFTLTLDSSTAGAAGGAVTIGPFSNAGGAYVTNLIIRTTGATTDGALSDAAARSVVLLGTLTLDIGTSSTATLFTDGTSNVGTLAVTSAGSIAFSDSDGIILGASALSGNLTVTAGAGITQSGVLAVTGTSSFTAGADVITLTSANDFGGAMSFSNSGANAVQITDIDDIALGASSTGGALTVIAGGAITDTGALTVTGAATFETRLDGGANITIDDDGDATYTGAFGSVVLRAMNTAGGSPDAGTIVIREGDATVIAGLRTTSSATVQSGGTITDNAAVPVEASSLSVVSVGGTTIDSTGSIVAAFAASNSGGGAIALTNTATTLALNGLAQSGSSGAITVFNTGNLTSAAAIDSLGGAVNLTADGADALLTNSSSIASGGSTVALTADQMSLAGGTVNAGAGAVTLTTTAARATQLIDMGGADAAGTLGLTNAELLTITTTGLLTIGDTAHTGAITVSSGPINPTAADGGFLIVNNTGGIDIRANLSSDAGLTLTASGGGALTGAITRSTGTGTLAATGLLTLNAAEGIGVIAGPLPIEIGSVGSLSAVNTTSSGDIFLSTTGSATIDATGFAISAGTGGTIRVDAGTNLIINGNVSVAGTGAIALNAAGTITEQSAGAGTLTATTVSLGTTNATSVGTAAEPILTAATNLSAGASAGNVYLSNTGNANVAATASGIVDIANAGTTTTSGAVTAGSTATIVSTGALSIGHNATGPAGVTLTVSTAETLFSHTAGTIDGSDAAIVITADKMSLAGTAVGSATTDTVTLRNLTTTNAVDFGSAVDTTGNTLELSGTELSTVTGALTVGRSDGTGAITVSAGTTRSSSGTTTLLNSTGGIAVNNALSSVGAITLTTTAGVSGSGAVSTASQSLAVNAQTTINLIGASTVRNVSLSSATTGGNIAYTGSSVGSGQTLDITAVVGAGTGSVTIGETTGSVSNAAGAITAIGAAVSISAAEGVSISNNVAGPTGVTITVTGADAVLTHGAGAISTTNADITLVADDMALTGGTIGSGTGNVALYPYDTAQPIDLGTNTAGTLGLLDAEFDTITVSAPGVLTVGRNTHTGAAVISAALTPVGATGGFAVVNQTGGIDIRANLTSPAALALTANGGGALTGAITRSTGTGTLTATTGNLALSAATGIGVIAGPNPVVIAVPAGNFSATNTTGGSGDIFINTTGNVTVGVAGFALSQWAGGNVRVDSGGNLVINGSVNIGAGTLTLNAAGTITEQSAGAGTLTAATVNLGGDAGVGASGFEIYTDASALTAGAATSGDVYVRNTGNSNLTVSAASAAGLVNLADTGTGTVASGGAITAGTTVTVSSSSSLSIGHAVSGPGGVTLTAATDFAHNAAAIQSTNTVVAIQANTIDLAAGTVTSGTANTYLYPYTLNTASSLGGAAGFDLTGAELNTITAAAIVVGENSGATRYSGAFTIGASGAVALGAKNITVSGDDIQGGANAISTTGTLALKAVNGIGNTTPISSAASTISFANTTATAVDISNASAAGLSLSGTNSGGAVTVTETSVQAITVSASNIATAGGALTLVADDMTITGTIGTGAGNVSLYPNTVGGAISLGAGGSGLGLADAEIDQITTTGTLTIGAATRSGAIAVDGNTSITNTSGPVYVRNDAGGGITVTAGTLSSAGNLFLYSGGAINGTNTVTTNGGTGTLTVSAAGGIALTNASNAAATASLTNASGGNISYVNNHALTVTASNTAAGGTITVSNATGAMTVGGGGIVSAAAGAANITLANSAAGIAVDGVITAGGTGYVSLSSAGAATQTALITAPGGLLLLGSGSYAFGAMNNAVSTIAAQTSGAGAIAFNSAAALAVGTVNVTYDGITTVGGNVTLTTAAGNLTVSRPIDTSSAAGGAVSLTPAGNIVLNDATAVVTTNNAAVDFNQPVTLNQNTVISAGSGNVTFDLAVDADAAANNRTLTVNTTGATTFTGAIGSTQSLLSLETNAGGTTALNGTSSTTSGTQLFNDAVTLGADTTVTASTVTFFSTLGNSTARTLGITGNAVFGGTVGNGTSLTSLTVSGTADINGGSVNTSGIQTYSGAASLGADTNLTAGTVTFQGTMNGNANDLTITGAAVFGNDAADDASGLTTVHVTSTTDLYADITTTGNQNFDAAVTLYDNVTLVSDTGTMLFGTSVGQSGTRTLTVQNAGSTGTVTFTGAVTLEGLATGAGNFAVALNGGGSIATAVTFSNTGAASSVTIGNDAGDSTTFTGGVTATAPNSKSIAGTIAASGSADINLGTTATTVSADATIGGGTTGTLTLGAVTIGSGVTLNLGAGNGVDVVTGAIGTSATGFAIFNSTSANPSTIASFVPATNNASTLMITNVGSGGLTFTGSVGDATHYLNALTFAAAISSTGTVSFDGAVYATDMTPNAGAGNYNLAFNAGGTFTNAVTFANGGTLAIGDNAADTLTFDGGVNSMSVGGTVTTYGTILTSNDAITLGDFTLGADTVLDTAATTAAGAVSIGSVTGGAFTLEITTGATFGSVTQSAGTITADRLQIITGGSVGAPLSTAVSYLEISAGGSVNVSNSVALTVGFPGGAFDANVNGVSSGANQALTLVAAAGISADEAIAAGGSGILTITANLLNATITTTAALSSGSGAVNLTADQVTLGANVSSTGALTIQPLTAATTVSIGANTATFAVEDGEIAFLQNGFSSITLGKSDSGAVSVDTAAFLDPVVILGGGTITIAAGTPSLSTSQDNAGITITATGADIVANGGISANGSGIIDINSGAAFTLADLVAIASGTGAITIDTTGANDMAINGNISTAGAGAITATASRHIIMDATSLVSTANGAVILDADAAAAGSLTLDQVTSSGGALITLQAGTSGSITEADDTALVSTSGLLFINDVAQGSSIGGAGASALNINAGTLRIAAAGSVYLNETDAVTIGDGTAGITTSAGVIEITAGGAVTLANAVSTTAAGTTITIQGTNVALNAGITAVSPSAVTLTATSGAITRTAGVVTSTGGVLALTANSYIGTSTVGNEIYTNVGTLRATASGGGIYISEADGIVLADGSGNISATGGTIAIATTGAGNIATGGGTISATGGGVTITAASGTLTTNDAVSATNGTVTMTATGALTTNASVATLTSGNIFLTSSAGAISINGIVNSVGMLSASASTLLTLAGTVTAGTTASFTGTGSGITVTGAIAGGTGLATFNQAVAHSAGSITSGAGGMRFADNYVASGAASLVGASGADIDFRGATITFIGFTHNTNRIVFTQTLAQTFNSNGQTLYHVAVDKSGGSLTLDTSNVAQAAGGALTFASTAATTLALNALSWTLGANMTVADGFSTLTVGTGQLLGGAYDIAVGTAAGTGTLTIADAPGALSTTGSFSVGGGANAGTVTLGTGPFSVGPMSVAIGSFTQTGLSAVDSAASISVSGGSLSWDTGTLTVTNGISATAGTLDFGDKTITAATLSVTGSTILALNSAQVTLSSAPNAISTAGTISDTASLITLNGAGNLTLDTDEPIGDLTVGANTSLIAGGLVKTLVINPGFTLDLNAASNAVSLLIAAGDSLTANGTLRVADSTNAVTLASQTAGNAFTFTGTDIDYNAKAITLRDINAPTVSTDIESGAGVTIQSAAVFLNVTLGGSLTLNAGSTLNCAVLTAAGPSAITNSGANTVTASGSVSILGTFTTPLNSTLVMTGAGTTLAATPQIGDLTVGAAASVTLGSALSLADDLSIVSGGTLDVSASNWKITIAGNTWNNQTAANGFAPRAGEVEFTLGSGTVSVYGNNDWYDFTCSVPGLIFAFENDRTQQFQAGGTFSLTGTLANPIVLTRMTFVDSADLDWVPPAVPAAARMWQIDMIPTSNLDLTYVEVGYSDARAHPIVKPDDVVLTTVTPDYDLLSEIGKTCFKWLNGLEAVYSYVEDSDGNGKVDRIRVRASAAMNGDFSGFSITVTGYDIDTSKGTNGFVLGSGSLHFYAYLAEKTYLDGNAVPTWRVTANTSLKDNANNKYLLAGIDEIMTPVDTAPPVPAYALSLPGRAETYFRFSEPVYETGGTLVPAGSFSAASSIGSRLVSSGNGTTEFLLNLGAAPTAATLAAGTTMNLSATINDAATQPPIDYATDSAYLGLGYPAPEYPTAYGDYSVYAETGSGGLAPPNLLRTADQTHRLTDVLVSVPPASATDATYFIWPIWARDSVTTEIAQADYETLTGADSAAQTIGLARDFTGTQWLRDQDITLEARVNQALGTPSAARLHFDTNTADDYKATDSNTGSSASPTGLWLPVFSETAFSGIVPSPNGSTSTAGGSVASGQLWDFPIDSDDPKVTSVSTLDFFFTLGAANTTNPLYAARLDIATGATVPSDWYARVLPFSFDIHDVTRQRGSVTILNNVINPNNGETTRVSYQLEKSGRVTIQVFTLDGDLVKVLYRGSRAAGDYSAVWDGKNMGGRSVARGIYFIRVVAPEIDEIRKVMIVK